MRIPGWIYIVVGTGMGLITLKLVLEGQKMGIFILVGVGMIVFGIVRSVQDRKTSQEEVARHEPLVTQSRAHHQTHPHQHPSTYQAGMQPEHQRPAHAHEIPRMCSTCGARNNPRANYCGHCGNHLRE